MKIFADFHHGGLARSIFYLFADRLGHEIRFPSYEFAFDAAPGGIWNAIHAEWVENMGGIDRTTWDARAGCVTRQEFMDTAWDALIISRCETQTVLDKLAHPGNPLRIGFTGNEYMAYDWTRVRHLIATDEASFGNAPDSIARILTMQEIGRHYAAAFVPPSPESLRRIHSFVNNWPGMNKTFHVYRNCLADHCPHCGSRPTGGHQVNLFAIWQDAHRLLPEYTFFPYGHFNEQIGGKCLYEVDLPAAYQASAVTLHFKCSEGYGHSVLQSVACGRPPIIGRGFFRHRMAGRFLIPGITCHETAYTAPALAATIRELTESLETATENAERCYTAAKALMNWQYEARRVKSWMDRNL